MIIKKTLLFGLTLITVSYSFSQSTTAGFGIGNTYAPFKFLGYDASNFNNPLDIRTNNLNRIIVSQLVNGSALIPGGAVNNVPGYGLTRIGINYDGNNPITFPRAAPQNL